ncbi:MAG: hypothetical protein FWD06_05215 [Oscillospiraceae bacterium]|nr:hypothetical protein [Oscillospiraceae bacterium]
MDLIEQLHAFMVATEIDYAICGGHAIDLFVGKKTRPHKDLDLVVYWEDRDRLVAHMLADGWDVYEPCGTGYLHKINAVDDQLRIKMNIWCVQSSNPHYTFTEHEKDMYAVAFDDAEQTELDFIEFLFNTRQDGAFLFARNHDIKRSLNKAILHANGVPYLAPELVLLYKSQPADHTENQLDFECAAVKLNAEQRAWLQHALAVLFPDGHKWLAKRSSHDPAA